MSGLALMMHDSGYTVSGSDRDSSANTEKLAAAGIRVAVGQSAANITPDIDLAVYTVAVGDDNPELTAAKDRGIPLVERGRFLGMISRNYRHTVSVSGTHGKTTTTAMLSSVMLASGADPAIHIGGTFPLIGGSVRPSQGDCFITEACEYHEHMLEISSFGAIILNVESEHLDYYKTDSNIDRAFSEFAGSVAEDGFVVVNAQSERAMAAASHAKAKVVTFSLCDSGLVSDFEAANIVCFPDRTEYDLVMKGSKLGRIVLTVPGLHNVTDSLAAAAAAWQLGAGFEAIKEGLKRFTGTGRRFELKGTVRGARLIDDYAHHPTEVFATLKAAYRMKGKTSRIIAVLQIHTYSRAIEFGEKFAQALRFADEVIVTDIYAAREKDPGTVSGQSIAKLFADRALNAKYIGSFEEIASYISSIIKRGDVVITLGAGDVNKILGMIR